MNKSLFKEIAFLLVLCSAMVAQAFTDTDSFTYKFTAPASGVKNYVVANKGSYSSGDKYLHLLVSVPSKQMVQFFAARAGSQQLAIGGEVDGNTSTTGREVNPPKSLGYNNVTSTGADVYAPSFCPSGGGGGNCSSTCYTGSDCTSFQSCSFSELDGSHLNYTGTTHSIKLTYGGLSYCVNT